MSSWGEHHDELDELYTDPSIVVGVWADRTVVRRERSVFTVDFIRYVPESPRRVLVARVIVSVSVALDLRDQLDEWRDYTEWSMPEGQG